MFKKKEYDQMTSPVENQIQETFQGPNKLLEGSVMQGDLSVACDLEVGGEVRGNIHSEKNATIILKGICQDGNIHAGGNVEVLGKFDGGEIKAQGRCYINGDCRGKVEAFEVELGPEAQVSGEIIYHSSIQISEGARVEAKICYTPTGQVIPFTERNESTESRETIGKEENLV